MTIEPEETFAAIWAQSIVPIPPHTRMQVSGFSQNDVRADPEYYVRPAMPALEELARFDSPEDAAVAHAVTLEPPEVDFINRAIEGIR